MPLSSPRLVHLAAVVAALTAAAAVSAHAANSKPKKLHPKRMQIRSLNGQAPGAESTPSRPFAVPLRTMNPQALAEGKARAARRAQRSGAYGPRTSVRPDSSAAGFSTWTGLTAAGGSPSDSNGSISPAYYVETVNSNIAAYSRSDHSLASTATLATLTGGVGVCDPRVEWNDQQSRWLYVALRCDGTTSANALYVGWSKTSDPTDFTTGWCKFSIGTGTTFFDYPKLGDNAVHIAIGTNNFSSGGSFLNSALVFVPKPPLSDTSCTPPAGAFVFSIGSNFTPVPANMFDDGVNGFVVSGAFGGSTIHSYRYTGGGGAVSPSVFDLGTTSVTAFTFPANAPQPGSGNVLDTLDTRLTTAVGGPDPDAAANPAVWTEHTVDGPGGRSQVTWYELTYNPAAAFAPSLRQRGVQSSTSQFYFNGAISPTTLGNEAVLHYNGSGTTAPQFPQVLAVSRIGTDPLGTMVGEKWIFTSSRSSTDFTCTVAFGGPPCRWGDYASASPDPSDPRAVWGTNGTIQSSASDNDWSTRNFGLSTTSVFAGVSAGVLAVTADAGQVNKLTIADIGGGLPLEVSELSWPTLRVSGGCVLVFSSRANCPTASSITVSAGDQNDTVTLTGTTTPAVVTGGAGADSLTGGGGNDTLNANDGTVDTAVNCGAGASDVANVDAGDLPFTSNCETVNTL